MNDVNGSLKDFFVFNKSALVIGYFLKIEHLPMSLTPTVKVKTSSYHQRSRRESECKR